MWCAASNETLHEEAKRLRERLGLELTGNRAQAHETLYETNLYQRLAPAFTRAPRGEPRAGCTLPQHQP